MKELSIEDNDVTQTLEYLFPELKESEDERIRKALVAYFTKFRPDDKWVSYCSFGDIVAWLEKQGEQKPVDKIEPKFNLYDWVVTDKGDIVQIGAVNNGYYTLFNGMDFNTSYVDKCWHLWTIEDAKDGDVLAESSCIFMIQKLDDNNTAETYCTLYNDGDFDDGTILYFDIDSTKPATKEQRNQLEKAMADAGYTFDFEKKELKKIKQKPAETEKGAKGNEGENPNSAWSEEDEMMIKFALTHFRLEGATEDSDIIKWLKSLRPQKWNKKDKERYISCLQRLGTGNPEQPETINSKWFKEHVYSQTTWKPSDEQMDALEKWLEDTRYKGDCRYVWPIFESLYNDLKKLREE